jgi:hypothetical protein
MNPELRTGNRKLLLFEAFPILNSATSMRNYNRSPNNIRYSERFEYFVFCYTQFVAFSEVILDAIITTQDHRGDQSEQFFGLHRKCAFLVSIGVEVEKAFENEVVLGKDFLIHAGAVVVEVCYESHEAKLVKGTRILMCAEC